MGVSELTREWLEQADMKHRASLGQFMTPASVRDKLLDRVDLKPGMKVLDPAAGTGELLRGVLDRCPGVHAEGWDKDRGVLRFASRLIPEASLQHRDALRSATGEFDLVVANPPYFQVKMTEHLKEQFGEVISGRPNVYALFFKVALDMAKDGGQVAFIVPPSMNAGSYFTALRDFIDGSGEITHLEILDGNSHFHNANVAVQIITVRKGGVGSGYMFSHEAAGHTKRIFCEDPDDLQKMFSGKRTLHEAGFRVFTGPVTWNARKTDLGAGDGSTRLFWAHNIGDGEIIEADKPGKPGWIRNQPPITTEAVLVNRITGQVGNGTIRAAKVMSGFTAENHVNVIVPVNATVPLDLVVEALRDETVLEALKSVTGNTQISASELMFHLPLGV